MADRLRSRFRVGGSSVSPFIPLSLPGLLGWYHKGTAKNQAANGLGTPATAQGHVVRYWADGSGNGNHISSASTGFILNGQGGDFGVKGNDTSTELVANLASPYAAGDFSFYALVSVEDLSAPQRAFNIFQSSGFESLLSGYNATGNTSIGNDPSGGRSPWVIDGNLYFICWTRAGSLVTLYVDGVPVDTFSMATTFNLDSIRLGHSVSGMAGTIQEFAVASVAHNAETVQKYHTYLRSVYTGGYLRKANGWHLISNSLGAHLSAGPPVNTLCQKTKTLMNTSAQYVNGSIDGRTTPQMELDIASREVAVAKAMNTEKRVYVVWEGTNDIVTNGKTGAQAAAALLSLADTIRTADAGARIVIGTVINRNAVGFYPKQIECNDSLIANRDSTIVDAIVDLTEIATVSSDGAHANATYFADGMHLTSAGYAEIDDAFAFAIDATFDSAIGTESTNFLQAENAAFIGSQRG